MLALYVFGTQLEAYMGSVEFLLYYLVTGVLAGAFSFGAYLFVGGWYYQLLGASGAIFAIQLAYAVFFPNNVIYFWGIFPLRAPIVVILFTAVEVFFSISGFDTGVAHLTHLAGFFFGGLFFALRYRINPLRRLFRR
jgi:membrane associated rhomboid family serine protease